MIHTYLANKVLQLITAKAPYSENTGLCSITGTGFCYLGLSATEPDAEGKRVLKADGSNFNEPDPILYPSYERIQVSVAEALNYTDKFGDVANGTVSNAQEFTSRECLEEGGYPTFYHFGLFDSKTGGNLMVSDVLRDPDGVPDENGLYPEKELTVAKGKVAVFRAGALQLTLK